MKFRFWSDYKIVKVEGSSMLPNINPTWKLLFKKIKLNQISRNDIILLHHETKLIIKRTVGLPGEFVEIKDGELVINDKIIIEPHIETTRFSDSISKWQLGQNEYVLLGDNSNDSLDSRKLGPIFLKEEMYILKCRLWPIWVKSNKTSKRIDHGKIENRK